MIDRDSTLSLFEGDLVALQYQRQFSDGRARSLDGGVFAFTIFASDGTTISSEDSIIAQDILEGQTIAGDLATMTHPPETGAALVDVIGAQWELAQRLPGNVRQRIDGGRIVVTRSASTIAGSSPTVGDADIDLIIDRDAD